LKRILIAVNTRALLLCLGVGLGCQSTPLAAASVIRQPWGRDAGGEAVDLYTIRDGRAELEISNYGARMVAIRVPDRSGKLANVLLSGARPEDLTGLLLMAGATLGRYAGRIAGGQLDIDGQRFALRTNLAGHTLHGGPVGFNVRLWSARKVSDGVELRLLSADGDMGFPGALSVRVTYTLKHAHGRESLTIHYQASTTAPTVVNLSNHAFFNLSGDRARSVQDEQLMVQADRYLPTDPSAIPTGEVLGVAGGPLDFREPRTLGIDLPVRGYDSTLILSTQGLERAAATLTDPVSGRTLTLYTSEPALQVFTVPAAALATGAGSSASDAQIPALSLEPQHYPDAPHHADFPDTLLRPGQAFESTTRYEFAIVGEAGRK
jgi:aldose 1-epimerase